MAAVTPPRIEGTVKVGAGRTLGFAEFGRPGGRAIFWLHGTPGGRRQIPQDARAYADREGVRVIGIDRPGIGRSTPHVYPAVADFAADLDVVAERLGVDDLAVVGLSGGGPFALAVGHALPDRVRVVAVLGGVAPTVGDDAVAGGVVGFGRHAAPAVRLLRLPAGAALTGTIRVVRPLASPILDLYARLSPPGDRELLARPEFKAMFLDDLLTGSRTQLSAPLSDVLAFSRSWGFDLADVKVPVRWWHGDDDNIVPLEHGRHVVARLPDATLRVLPGQSHLGGLGVAEEILTTVLDVWDEAR
jgi:pimeloyl-ACP methyl ester carboxylesterase